MATNQVKQKAATQITGDFQTDARNFGADGKLTEKERGQLLDAFKKQDRETQLKSLDFLKGESKVLAGFARSNASLNAAQNQRVGGDRTLGDFKTMVDGARDKGFSPVETDRLKAEYRALAKGDQQQALADLRGEGQEKLAAALESSIDPVKLTKKQEAAVGSKDLAAFDGAFAALKGGKNKTKDRLALTDIFRKLSDGDKQTALSKVKNEDPRLARQLDSILNPRALEKDKFGNPLATGN